MVSPSNTTQSESLATGLGNSASQNASTVNFDSSFKMQPQKKFGRGAIIQSKKLGIGAVKNLQNKS